MRTRPRTPCGAATTPSRTRAAFIRGGTGSGGRLHALLRLGARLRLLGLVAAFARLHHLGLRQELGDAVRRLSADLQPMRDALLVERDALSVLARQQGVVGAELLDEAAIARAARIGHDDVEERPLLGTVTGHTNSKHSFSFDNFSAGSRAAASCLRGCA